ncbi:MAG: hypothetical protein DRQ61_01005 [Gammaproteobacteria bacterium]|nr:MAG: hypothetical protein DRQ56_00320 [Gammaproteobacteria bacterium]RLA24406.1 MAG: hypothetical protein DRQ61_01005 [Gammaproteobacteria bacterium]
MSDKYITLTASFPPHLPNLFATKQTPISQIKLDERLQMLESKDANDLAAIIKLFHWDQMQIDTSDAEMIKRWIQVKAQIKNEFIKEIVLWRLEERTFIAALRQRHLGKNAPVTNEQWGYGRWLQHIRSHWNEPAFGLGQQLPWLIDAERLLKEENYLGLERLLLGRVWDYYGRVVGMHYFDFEAVVVYVLRWDVIDRWSHYNIGKSEKRFNDMAESALGEYAKMFS